MRALGKEKLTSWNAVLFDNAGDVLQQTKTAQHTVTNVQETQEERQEWRQKESQ